MLYCRDETDVKSKGCLLIERVKEAGPGLFMEISKVEQHVTSNQHVIAISSKQ
jgi:hypothetical protein